MPYPSVVHIPVLANTPQPNLLPPVSPTNYALYQPEGFAYTQYKMAGQEVNNPNNPWYVKATFLALKTAVSPLALAEEYIARPLVNVPFTMQNAGVHMGEHIARASMLIKQGEYRDAGTDILSAVQSGSEGFVAGSSVGVPVAGAIERKLAASTPIFRNPVNMSPVGTPVENLVEVSKWGRSGLQPDDWIVPGAPSWATYLRSFKFDPFFNEFAPISQGESFLVLRESIKWPTGWGIDGRWKGLYRQRKYRP